MFHAPMFNAENLAKQAKLVLKQHRSDNYSVCTRIRAGLTRFARASDRQILDSPFALHDAQEVIARENGFEGWASLKMKGKIMSKSQATQDNKATQPRLSCAFPQLFTKDVKKTAAYYEDKLGFKIQYLYGEPPFYGLVMRDGVGLNIRFTDETVIEQALKEKADLLSANIPLDAVKALFLEFKAKGVVFHQSLKAQPWHAEDFVVKDIDGNLLLFSSHPKKSS